MKFNLQYFAQVRDAFGNLVEDEKKIIIPRPVDQPTVIAPTVTKPPVVEPPVETDAQKQARELFERQQAGQTQIVAEGGVDLTRQTEEQRKAQQLKDAIAGEVVDVAPVSPAKTTNISDLIKKRNQEATNAALALIRQRISEGKAAQQDIIAKVPQQFDPLRAQSEVAKSQQLRSTLERSANFGDRGGIGRQEALLTQTEGEKRLNEINLAQENVISNANAEILRLENEGKFQEAQVIAANASQELQELITEAQRQEDLNREESIRQEGLTAEASALERQQFIETLGRFQQDFTAQINKVANDGDPTNDWQLPLLETARQEKIQAEGLDPATGEPLPVDTTPTLTASSALDLWEQTGVASEAISRALGVPVGERFVRRSTGGGTGGLTASNIATNARFKLSNGIPLSTSEANILGLQEGFVDPNFRGVEAEEDEKAEPFVASITAVNDAIGDFVGDTDLLSPAEIKDKTLEWIVQNEELFLNDVDLLKETMLRNGNIKVEELQEYEEWRDRALGNTAFQ